MAIIEVKPKDPVTLRADVIDMSLLHLLETRYVVIIEQRDNEIQIELYKKQKNGVHGYFRYYCVDGRSRWRLGVN